MYSKGDAALMGLLDIFKKSKDELSDKQKKWNKMWELWVNGCAASPYAELMTYQSEVNNGGHSYYFYNIGNSFDLQKGINTLETVLSDKLRRNLQDAYHAHLALVDNESDENSESVLERCDEEFYENEDEIKRTLEEYAAKIEL